MVNGSSATVDSMEKRPGEARVLRVSPLEGYDLWAEDYDAAVNPVVAMDRRYTLPVLSPAPNERILDAGCGTGANLEPLLQAGAAPVGIDFSSAMLRVAHRRLPGVPLCVADLQEPLPIADASFDAALCALVGEHLDGINAVLAELRRVLKQGGRLVFSVYHPEMAAVGIEANFERAGIEYRLGGQPYTLHDYLEAFAEAGFDGFAYREYRGDASL
ncbi:MAG TPA: class I SAM-dependent methyltransferase, partial [Dehalococcoidia bacterium]|nr:class I SAM-dependent methyltransferase [Dehalococcoidia bacterium]